MTRVEELVASLRERDVRFVVDGDEVAVDAPEGVLSPADIETLRAHKIGIANYFLERLQSERIVSVDRGGALPLSSAQERLWLTSHFPGIEGAYHVRVGMRFHGRLDQAALVGALNAVVERHETLRTVFIETSDGVAQLILKEQRIALPQVDLLPNEDGSTESEIRRQIDEEARSPFDLRNGPLLRCRLLVSPDQQILLITMHHIVSDGWSMGIFMKELAEFYRAHREGGPIAMQPLSIQYADYAAWQRKRAEGEPLQHQIEYWKRQLQGAEGLELPLDRARAAVRSYTGRAFSFLLPQKTSAALKRIARVSGATPYMTTLALFQALLARLTGQLDIVVATLNTGRTRPEFEPLIGFFVNTILVRDRIETDDSFVSLLARVKETLLEAFANQEVPFDRVVAELRERREGVGTPLSRVAFMYQYESRQAFELPGVRCSPLALDTETTKTELLLAVEETQAGLQCAFEYSTALFDESTIELFARRLECLADAISSSPDRALKDIPLLGEFERRLIEEFNGTREWYPDVAVHELFESRVEVSPDAVAVVFEEASIAYAELNRRANQVAHYLRRQGVGPDSLVCVCMERSVELLIALFGILKAGGAYVPLDPEYPEERLRFMLADANPRVVLTQEKWRSVLSMENRLTVALDGEWSKVAGESEANLSAGEVGLTPRHLAYVIYTSGSTGAPKGVMVEHRSLVNYSLWKNRFYAARTTDAALQKAPIGFDMSVSELVTSLLAGARVVVARPGAQRDVNYLREVVEAKAVTTVAFVPSMLKGVLADWPRFDSLRHMGCGGEVLSPELAEEFHSRAGEHCRLFNLYGPTETTILVAHYEYSAAMAASSTSVPIGKPISNVRFYVMDAEDRLAPIGVAGELCVAGACVARGYWNQPALTRERFVRDPFSEAVDERMYRTGDLVRWLPDGNLEFIGRKDDQVKIRGHRIELGEIESHLRRIDGVRDAVVSAIEQGDEKRLVAYIVPAPEATLPNDTLRNELKGRLPEYMVPSAYVRIEGIPLTANGKVDRQALPAPGADAYLVREYEAPRGEIETALAEIWQALLGVDRIGRHDNFFELGGHSLLAVQVLSRVRQQLCREVPLQKLFEHLTLSELARSLRDSGTETRSRIAPADRSRPLPLSPVQQRLWFLEQLGGVGSAYHVPIAIRLQGQLDEEALRRALDRMVERHEVLRTSVIASDGDAVQVIEEGRRFAWRVIDLQMLQGTEREQRVRAETSEEATAVFELSADTLIRGRLLKLAAEEHVLLITLHHIVSDGWSVGIVFKELAALYAAYVEGRSDPLPELTIQYADYAAWQRKRAEGEPLQHQIEYWKRQLQGAEGLELPLDRARAAVRSYTGRAFSFLLSPSTSAALKSIARVSGATPYMTTLALFQALLARLTGQLDIVVATLNTGRTRPEFEPLIGFFVNTILVRDRIETDDSFVSLLARVKETLLEAFANQEVPFDRVVAELRERREGVGTPLSRVAFMYQYESRQAFELPGVRCTPLALDTETTKTELLLAVEETQAGLQCAFEYSTALFDESTIELFARRLEFLADAISSSPDRALKDIPLLGEFERRLLIEEFNETEEWYPDVAVHELFESRVGSSPDAVAVVFEEVSITYAELNRRANQVAHYLRRQGVGPDSLVCVCMERSVELLIALFGILKAGGAYVPLDPEYPEERLRFMLADANPRVVLTQEKWRSVLSMENRLTVALDGEWSKVAGESEANLSAAELGLTPRHLAYVIYTSGSTGAPKGVMVEHRSLVNYSLWKNRFYAARTTDAALQKAPIGFDMSVSELVTSLLAGARVVVARPGAQRDVNYLREIVEAKAVTTVAFVPSMLKGVLADWPRFDSLRHMGCGGEVLSPELAEEFHSRAGEHCRLFNLYGPTETTILVAHYECYASTERSSTSVPIGKPISNVRFYVMDAEDRLAPIGVAGELCVAGACVARGYWNQPALTRERFVRDPFSEAVDERMYRTGDLVRWLPDGNLEFIGRKDDQVKIRGHRIELGEIESHLRRIDGVRDAVVSAIEQGDEKRLVAYIVPAPEATLPNDTLRNELKGRLPEYMVPSAYVRIEGIPLTANGKVDRQALPAPGADAYLVREYEAPRGEIETALAEIWQALLGVDRIGRHDNFFELGGHSLLAVQAVSRVRKVLGRELVLRKFFDRPTLLGLARELSAIAVSATEEIVRAERSGRLPLSLAQQRLWFIEQLGGVGSAYHVPIAIRLQGQLDEEALRRALDRMVERHEVLRTSVVASDGDAVQVIEEGRRFAWRMIDLQMLHGTEREQRVRAETSEEATAVFELSADTLIRGRLLKLAAEEHVLLITLHHIVSDGWSVGIVFKELAALYAAYVEGRSDPLPELTIQYADYAVWQRSELQSQKLREQLTYWRESLHGAPVLELPSDRPRPAVQSFRGASIGFELGVDLTRRLQALSRLQDATLFMTLYAGFAVLLSKLSGQSDVVIGVPVANRQRAELEGLVGFFVNTLALRVQWTEDAQLAEVLKQVRRVTLEGYSRQEAAFEQVVETVQPPRSLSHNPIFQVMFTLQNAPASELRLPGLQLSRVESEWRTAKFDLQLMLHESAHGLSGGFTYATDLFDRETIERWIGYFKRVLEEMVRDVRQEVNAVSLLGQEERLRVLRAFNATSVPYPGQMVHELVEAQAARTPDAIALEFGQMKITYAELNARANRLAHYLKDRGVGPDRLVGLCIERSFEQVVGLLGVLKSGGAYVPLDPNYPRERIEYMLDDSRATIVLSLSSMNELLPATSALVVNLDCVRDELAAESPDNLDRATLGLTPNHLAYVIYTSGSTGRPKGVMVEHGSVTNFLLAMSRNHPLTANDRMLAITSLSFDIAALEIYWPLVSGAQIVLADRASRTDAKRLVAALEEREITVLQATPMTWQLLLNANWSGRSGLTALCGGEALSAHLARELQPRVGALWNLYGPTETTIWSSGRLLEETSRPCGGESSVAESPAIESIGRPISNTQIYVLDAHGNPAAVGLYGEIYIGGAGVARGYWDREELTAERFLSDPFSSDANARMYRTGDIGRWRTDGNLEYVGRNDDQVKIRGYRIELGEIESQLRRCDGVKDAVVSAREEDGEKRLVAYVTHKEGASLQSDALLQRLSRALPAHMVPAAYVQLEKIPLTVNGKVDRRGLPAPGFEAYPLREYAAPQGETEETLAGIWQELLRIERVGRHDHFFELGGHSLLIMRLVERLRRLDLCLEIRSVFEHPVLKELARAVNMEAPSFVAPENLIPENAAAITPEMLTLIDLKQREIDAIVAAAPGGVGNVQDIYPLTPLQEGILFHHLVDARRDAYVLPMLLAFDSRARFDAFALALQGVIDRHDSLRSAVLWKDLPRPVQVVYRHAPLIVEDLAIGDTRGLIDEFKSRVAKRSFRIDIERAPLLRLLVAREAAADRYHAVLLKHHLMMDHASLDLVLNELDALSSGSAGELPAPLSYRDHVFAVSARARMEDSETYFRGVLGDVSSATAPFGILDVRGGSEVVESRRRLDDDLAQRIRLCGRRLGVSAAALFHAAYALVVARASGRDEAVFGTVLAGRSQGMSDADRVVGLFINTLPIRIALTGVSVEDLVVRAHDALAGLLRHEHASLSVAQRCSGVDPTMPLFTAILNYRHSASAIHRADRAEDRFGARVLGGGDRTNYPFVVSVDDLGRGFSIVAQTDRRVDAGRVAEYVVTAVESLVRSLERRPDVDVESLSILSSSERNLVLEAFNATTVTYSERTVHELFEEQVVRTPNGVAIECEGELITYAELNRRSNQLARYLQDRGVRPGCLVAVCMERSIEMVVSLLGTLKAGAAYVPLDSEYPQERLAHMLADAQPRVVLSQRRTASVLPETGSDIVNVDDEWRKIALYQDANLDRNGVGVTVRHLAYVIYTSGSTGVPKGVMNEHRGVVNRLRWMQDAYELLPSDRVLQKTSFSFDVSVWEFFWTLGFGARLVLAKPGGHRDPRYLSDLIRDAEITTLHFVPSMLGHFLSQTRLNECSSVRQVICSGEELPGSLAQECLRALPRARLYNLYGPTEAAIDVTSWECSGDANEKRVPIGRPISNTRIYILDAGGSPVPIGVNGEIHIGGVGVARGYWNREELTAHRFVRDPFNADPVARMYKTGDLGKWRADGVIEYLGRNDAQVKLRGYRIELGEIECQLRRDERVQEAVVVLREDGEKRLVAYLTTAGDDGFDSEELRTRLSRCLPGYMLPSAFVRLKSIPLTVNGKLDRRQLPAPGLDAYAIRRYEPPEGEVEETLASIWQEVLSVPRVGRHDHFFELGGHSLLIVRMLERLRRVELHVEIRNVFEHPTLMALAATLQRNVPEFSPPPNLIPDRCAAITPELLTLIELTQDEINTIVATVPGGAPNVQDIYPLTPLQEGILFHHLLDEQTDAYVLPLLMEFESKERLDAWTSALQKTVDRHDSLRTAILWRSLNQPVQVVYRQAKLAVEEVDLADALIDRLDAWLTPGRLRMNLEHAVPIRVDISHDARSNRWFALLLKHHIAMDHVALERVMSEVRTQLMGSDRLEDPPTLRPYIARALAMARRGVAEAFFRRQLSDIDGLTAPFGLANVRGDGSRIEEARKKIEFNLAMRMRKCARRLGVSTAALAHAAYALTMSGTSGRDDVVFGTVLSGRLQELAGADRVVGLLINTLPIRVKLGDARVCDVVQFIHSELSELVKFEQTPLAEARRSSGLSGSTPLFAAILNYRHNAPDASTADFGDGRSGIRAVAGYERSNYPFVVSIDDWGDGFGIVAQTDRSVDPMRIANYVQLAIESLVEALERAPETSVGALTFIPEAERRSLLEEFTVPKVERSRHRLMHQLFEEQVAKSPGAVAVYFEDESVTYGQLNERANRLAHFLRTKGVGPERLVGVCMERSAELIVGLLAILKAGGAYVPLDPDYPQERLRYLLDDAEPCVVLTQERLRSRLPTPRETTVAVDSEWTSIAHCDSSNIDPHTIGLAVNHLAYVIYTSGSTGQPKGALVEHKCVPGLLAAVQSSFQFKPSDVWALFHSYAFDFAVWELWAALTNGCATVVVPQSVARSPKHLLRLLDERKVTILNQTPSALRQLIDVAANEHGCADRLCLRQTILGGEVLTKELARDFRLWIGERCRLTNIYGPTETTIFVSHHDYSPESARMQDSIPIGKPIASARLYVLDSHSRLTPIGAIGELCVAGSGVARGYLKQEELTRSRFVPDPFGAESDRMYRTGDLVRWLPDGNLEYIGRNDAQVKLRGYRIELAEIEAQLRRQDCVKEAVVVVRNDERKHLVAYVVTESASPLDDIAIGTELRSALRATLPEYMVPSAIVRLKNLPLNRNGKVDIQMLPPPGPVVMPSAGFEAPRGDSERALASIVIELLHVERVGRHDDFFALGGDSLLAVKFIARVARQLRIEFPLNALFEHSTIARLAELAGRISTEGGDSCLAFVRRASHGPNLFLVHPGGGQGLVYRDLIDQLQRFSTVYLIDRPELGERRPIRFMSANDLVDRYVAQILHVDPIGPFYVCGWSLGATLALLIARRLESLGKKVAYVGLIDGGILVDQSNSVFRDTSVLNGGLVEEELQNWPDERKERILAHWREEPELENKSVEDSEQLARYFHTFVANLWLLHDLTYPSTQLKVTHAALFVTDATLKMFGGMETVVSPLRAMFREALNVIEVPGNHFNIVENPRAAKLAAHIDGSVATATPIESPPSILTVVGG